MRILKKILLVVIILLIVILAGGYLYLRNQAPQLNGSLSLTGLQDTTHVLYDNYGVPHIYARNETDAYRALGYVHAQDRLFQMEMIRRVASGRLAEVLGPDQVKVDKLFRTLGLNVFAREHAQKFLSTDTAQWQQAALAYLDGINQFVEQGPTPVEFTIIGIPKQKFTPEDIYLAGGFMSFGFAEGLRIDPVLQKLVDEHGTDYLRNLAVQTPHDAVRLRSYQGTSNPAADKLITAIHESLQAIPVPQWMGSNGWVVSAARSTSGYPILANDTHIGFGQPAVWYEAHLEYPGFRFYGHHIAGIPFGLLGNNDFAAWGLTMFENDDTDFFRETVNPANANEVKAGDGWEALTSRSEVIHVKGEADVLLTVQASRHGPIINGMVDGVEQTQPVALSWTLLRKENEFVQAIYELNHAATFAQAKHAAASIPAPGLNIMYGDAAGNIAWWACASLPIRPSHVNSKLFLDGSTPADDYQGWYPFEKNPQAVNPPWGYVYSSNNQPDTVDGVLYPGYYYPKARAGRIVHYLDPEKKWSAEDMKQVNLDVVSTAAVEIATSLAHILRSTNKPEYQDLITLLETWDGDHPVDATAPTVYYTLLAQVIHQAMEDELGATALASVSRTSLLPNSYSLLINDEQSPWWDNVTTTNIKESRGMIVEQAAAATLSLLHTNLGTDPASWQWGKVHTLTHQHPLGAVKPLDKFFNVGPFVVPGGNEVLNNLMFELDTTGYFAVDAGPALRKIIDLGAIERGETVSPTGQSGNVMSPHYQDQASMFATGQFRPMLMNREAIEKVSVNRLLLTPATR